MVTVKAAAETESIMGDQGVPTYKPLEKLLDISPRWNLLASARNDSITIYKLPRTFSLFGPTETPDGERVVSISWHARSFGGYLVFYGYLLIRSRKSVSIWKIQFDGRGQFDREIFSYLNESVTSAQWISENDMDVKGFICTVGSIIKFFNEKCEEIPGRSVNISKLRKINRVIDAAFVRGCLLCLVDVDQELSQLFVLNVDRGNAYIQSTHQVSQGHTSMTVSLSSNKILLLGKYEDQVAELSISESNGEPKDVIKYIESFCDLIMSDKSESPDDAITFYGDGDKILVAYSTGEILVLHRGINDLMSALHIFTTQTGEAMPKKAVSFAVGRGEWEFPYMFAFAEEDGRVIIWSVQSNTDLDECPSAEPFEVHDRREGWYGRSTITSGKFLILPVNDRTETGGTDETDETDETDVLEYVRYLFTSV